MLLATAPGASFELHIEQVALESWFQRAFGSLARHLVRVVLV